MGEVKSSLLKAGWRKERKWIERQIIRGSGTSGCSLPSDSFFLRSWTTEWESESGELVCCSVMTSFSWGQSKTQLYKSSSHPCKGWGQNSVAQCLPCSRHQVELQRSKHFFFRKKDSTKCCFISLFVLKGQGKGPEKSRQRQMKEIGCS